MKNSSIHPAELKSALVKKLTAQYSCLAAPMVYQAVNEADALSFSTPVPLLLLPTLAEELVQKLAAWSARQHSLWFTNSVVLKTGPLSLAAC